ncbi:MAG: hypothetical protein K1X89_14680 [Myxococcaceae bacterium]|nr:hypothetical protein [Myxococcaceae bacterium]
MATNTVAAMPPHFWMPTRDQLRSTYKGIVQGHADAKDLKALKRAPAGVANASEFKNVGIKGIAGREDIFAVGGSLYLKNTTKQGDVSWFKAGPMPLF